MAQKTLNTRIKLKYDTFENWNSNNPILLAGELGIVNVPAEQQDNLQTTKPAILFKVGDGTSHFNDLPWASALAADVYAWAKAATKPSYTAGEVGAAPTVHQHVKADITDFPTKLSQFINDLPTVTDTNTTYKIVANGANGYKLQSKEKDGEWTDVADSVIDLTRLATAESEIDALQTSVGDVSGKVTTLIGSDSGKSARTIASEEVAKIVADADESFDTLKEIADWISTHSESASAMNSQISANKNAIAAAQTDITGIKDGTTAVGNALKLNGKLDTDFASAGAVTTLQGYFTGGKANTAVNAEQLGGHGAEYFATSTNLTAATDRIGALEGKNYIYEEDELILDCGTSSGL